MHQTRKPFACLPLFLVLLMLLAACSAPATDPGAQAPAESDAASTDSATGGVKELRVALTTFPNSLDMPKTAERNASNAAWQIYDSLVFINDEGALEPALAESWEVADDGVTYTFHLRPDVTFHNGEPFTAEAVRFSWERGQNPENQYFDLWTTAESVEVVDDLTVIVKTAEPRPLFLREMARNWAITPPGYISEVGEEEFLQKPVGTGPFKVVEWIQGDRIVMEAYENYWREGYPLVDRLIFRPIPESATRVAAIQTGEVDIVTRLSAEEADSLRDMADINVVSYPVDRVYYIAFNNLTTGQGTPVENQLVRQALNYAVDVDAIIDALFNGYAEPATGFVTPANWGYDDSIEPYGYDPDKARELLAEAGYADGFSIDFACPAGAYTNFEQVCEAVQGYLSEVGVQTELDVMESGAYWDLEANKELPPIFGDSWSATIGEALPRIQGALNPEASYAAWGDETIIDLVNQIGVTVDDQARAELYGELQHYMIENPPFIYLYLPVTFEAYSTRVQGHQPGAAEEYYLFHVDVSE